MYGVLYVLYVLYNTYLHPYIIYLMHLDKPASHSLLRFRKLISTYTYIVTYA